MSKAIRMYATGGPEVLLWEEAAVGEPGAGEAMIRHEAVGLNFIDVYHRTGLYPLCEAAQAHPDLEARKTTGSTVLIP